MIVYTWPHAVIFAAALPFAALALALWFHSWAKCQGCEKQRAHCKCEPPDVRKPKWKGGP